MIQDLLTSILRDLPVGTTLVLAVSGDQPPFISRALESAPETGERTTELLLDGQQRLTALWKSINDNYPDRAFFINITDTSNPEVFSVSRYEKKGKRYPFWVDKPSECWKRQCIPVKLLSPENVYQTWADAASEDNPSLPRKIDNLIRDLREQFLHFNLPYLYLPSETPKDVAIEVFIKLNTTYVPLTPFDIMVAQLEAATGEPLHELIVSLKNVVPEISNYTEPSMYVLAVDALLQDKIPSQATYLHWTEKELKQFILDWPQILQGTKDLVQFLKEESIIANKLLPTEPILAAIAALWACAPTKADDKGNVRLLLRKYMWRSFFTDRYDRAVPGAILQDYRALKKVIGGTASKQEVPCFNESEFKPPEKEEIINARWPTYKDRLPRSILLLSIRGGCEDIKDGEALSVNNFQRRHYHHLFPKAWLEKNMPDADPYRALNCILINGRTNAEISAKEPLQYLLETCEASNAGEPEIKRRLQTHFVDFDLLTKNDYPHFLEKRAENCATAIKSLFEGQPWRPC